MKFQRIPLYVTAEQFFSDKKPWPKGVKREAFNVFIDTLEGKMHVSEGDWIVAGIVGEKFPVKPDIFEKTYRTIESNRKRTLDLVSVEIVEGDAIEQLGIIHKIYPMGRFKLIVTYRNDHDETELIYSVGHYETESGVDEALSHISEKIELELP